MKKQAVGILAHVDAGKTTLSEAMLYQSGSIKSLGRVDKQNAFLDTDAIEKSRGITIFSKQAIMTYKDTEITLLDTPGHVDFSAEMERTFWVMDYAVLVISGADGVQGHTLTLWKLLKQYKIPVFIFVNKMDQPGTNREDLLHDLQKNLSEACVDFSNQREDDFYEQIAVCDEQLLEQYLDGGIIEDKEIARLISERKLFPCLFGSALKLEGIDTFMDMLVAYMQESQYGDQFGARVFKITRDTSGNRLTHLKVTGGSLKVKDYVEITAKGIATEHVQEKVNQIRLYSGEKYDTISEAVPGTICAVTGLSSTIPGSTLGVDCESSLPILEPVLTYEVLLPEDMDSIRMLPLLRQIEEEEPELHVIWQEPTDTILVKLMGEVQIEILKKRIFERFHVAVNFGVGSIVYKETIADTVEGVGHYEPLKHYAEVHLLLEPGERGSGMQLMTNVSEDLLDKNWQRLIITHLEEREHKGVLTGAALTDVRITVVGGRAHNKHTEGGDFRQSTYRAVRQGLMEAESVLLEPYYAFVLEIPTECVGRAMTDIESMHGNFDAPEIFEETAVLRGRAPVACMRDYQIQVHSYTKGLGRLSCSLGGYDVCHNADEIVAAKNYNPDEDLENPSSSVFCAHGAGYLVPWYEVKEHMHVEGVFEVKNEELAERKVKVSRTFEYSIDEEQINEIMNRTFRSNENRAKNNYRRQKSKPDFQYRGKENRQNRKKYLIVDGYNIVHAWDELKCLIEDNIDGARMKLMDILCNYQAYTKLETIVVFDAYRVKGNLGEMFDYHNIHVVYTKEAETADAYIEKLTHRISKDYDVLVATSDGLIQLITRGQNCMVMSALEFQREIDRVNQAIHEYIEQENTSN